MGELLYSQGAVPLSRVNSLITWLPVESATARVLLDDTWTTRDQLLAVIAEQVDATNRILWEVYADKDKSTRPEPLRIEWPGRRDVEPTPRQPSTKQEIAQFFGARMRVVPKEV